MPVILPGQTDIYALTDARLSCGRTLETVVSALLGAGVKIIQYREKHMKSGEMLEECRLMRRLTREAGACFIVDDHVDLAILAEADGVHIGQEDFPLPAVRQLVGPKMCIGLSTHSPEQARAAVAVGADPDRMAGVDNFCWCDPVQSEKTPDGEYKLAQLVRACKALSELCVAYGVPCISGKDSMKNDYTGGGKKISIPPTVLFSVLGIMDDVKKAVTSDFKKPGDRLYIIGNTARELAGSEIADQLGIACNTVPRVDAKSALASYRKLHQAINSRLISACHDLSDGGLAVSLAEMCIGGRLGAHLALNRVPVIGALTLTEALYSESASRLLVSVAPDKAAEFEALFGASAPFIGEVTSDARLTVASADSALFSAPVEALAHAFKATLDW